MPVDFLTATQKTEYGRFACEPNEIQLARYFLLDKNDLAFISNRRGKQNRLAVALQLTSVRFLGTFLLDLTEIPRSVQFFVAQQLSVSSVDILSDYSKRETTKREHTALIRNHYGYHEFSTPCWSLRLIRLLYARAWINNERPSLMFDYATAWLIQNKVLLPGVSTLTRLISEIRERANSRLWKKLASLPSCEQKNYLETLLDLKEGKRVSQLEFYRKGPVTISGPAFNKSIARFEDLRAFGTQKIDFSSLPPIRLRNLARYASVASTHTLARMSEDKRIAMLLAFAKTFEVSALDEALDVLDMLITDISGKAKRIGQKNRLRTLKDLDQSALTLAESCQFFLGEEAKSNRSRKRFFAKISKEKMTASIAIVYDLARPADDNFYDEIVEQYGRVRRFLPQLLNHVVFKACPFLEPA